MRKPTPTAQQIGQLLTNWDPTQRDDETHPNVRWYVKATFDHDWHYHILVMQWERTPDSTTFHRAGYSLWHIGTYNDTPTATYIDEWPNANRAPHIAAAAAVMQWERMCQS